MIKKEKRVFVTRYSKNNIYEYLIQSFGKRFIKYRQDWELSTKGDILPEFPLCLNYELFSACNLRCSHCVRNIRNDSNFHLGMKLFKTTINEGKKFGLPSIKTGFGEPFMEKELLEMIDYAKSKGVMDIIVTTNGTFLNDANMDKVLASGITFLRISLDAATGATYKKIRGADLGRLEDMVKRLMIRREERKLKLPIVRLSFVVMKENRHEIELFKNKWSETVDFIDFQDYIDISNLAGTAHGNIKSDFFCPYPWQMMPIMANGDIRACCSWYGEKGLVVGSLREMTIKEAWDSRFIGSLRERIMKKTYTGECAKCVEARKMVDIK